MTSKISLVKITQQKLSQNIWLLAASILTLFFTSPLVIFMEICNKNWLEQYTSLEYYSKDLCSTLMNNYATSIITVGAAFIIPLVLFKYINSKSEVDFYHSLPIKREKFFITNYILGLLIFIIPFLANTVLSMLIIRANVPFYSEFTSNFLYFTLTIILGFIAIYSVNVFSTIITGNVFMSVATGLGFMFLLPTVVGISIENLNILLNNYYINYELTEFMWENTNPLFYVLDPYSLNSAKNLTGCILTALIYTIIAYYFYKLRPSENASNPVSLNFLKPIIKFIGVFGATILGGYIFYSFNSQSVLWFFFGALLVSFIVHCAFEIIYESDFKALFSNLRHFIVYAAIVVLVFTTIKFDFIGFDNKLPELSQIGHIEISNDSYISDDNTILICESKNIETVYKLAQFCIEQDGKLNQSGTFFVKYYMKNGSTITRQYKNIDLNVAATEPYFDLVLSDEYINKENHKLIYEPSFINCVDFNNVSLSSIEAQEFYATYMQEYTSIPSEYFRYNSPVYDFYISAELPDDYDANFSNYSRFYVYECQLETLANISKYDNFDIQDTNFVEINLLCSANNADSSDYTTQNEQEFNQILQNTIPAEWIYGEPYIPYSKQDTVIVRFKYEDRGSAYGYINPEVANEFIQAYFSE
ncbi:MAG: hypothetical protein R3Y09_05895 [Clostridia bacterium]